MDVTFTNVLEGARQYFQGLPAATSSPAGPTTYSNPAEGLHRTNETEAPRDVPMSSAGGYWPQEAARPRADTSRPQMPTSNQHYQTAGYQEQQFQFPRPHSREAPSNVTQYQQYLPQRATPETPTSSQAYHQLQNVSQPQAYHNYQQQQQQQPQQRQYYPVQSPVKQQVPTSNSPYKGAQIQTSQQNAYYKHLYTPHQQSTAQMQYTTLKTSSAQENQSNQATSQAYRTTHNLPPIASLALNSYHSNRNSSREVIRPPSTKTTSQVGPPKGSTGPSIGQNSVRYPQENVAQQHDYRNASPYLTQNSRLPPMSQTYQYSTATTTTTQNYSQVIMTTSNSANSYATQSSYGQNSKLPMRHDVQRNHQSTNALAQPASRPAPTAKKKGESPLDLSLKTVRTPADSTLDDADAKYYARTPNATSHSYPTYDLYPNSFQRGLTAQRSADQSSATAPKVEFHPNFNVSSMNNTLPNNYRRQPVPDNKRPSYPVANQNFNRYPTVTVPTAAHVNSYIQSPAQQAKRPDNQNLPRVDFPPAGHGHKTAALYPVPTHDAQRKRPADTPPSAIIPNKMSKVDTWRQNIDQQIEQRLSTYQQQQAKHKATTNKPVIDGNYVHDRTKEMYKAYQNRQQYTNVPPQYGANQYPPSHNQTYVPSAGAHPYPGYAPYPAQQQQPQQNYPTPNLVRTNSNPAMAPNKSNLGGADKRVLSLLRNSLEIKGAKVAQKKLEQEQISRSYENLHKSRPDIQHPSTDVTAPLQPKPGFINRHNVSPFTPTNLPESNNTIYKLHLPKAIDSVNFESEPNKYTGAPQTDDGQSMIGNHGNGDLDGLAAYLAARIRTKAELKQVGPSHQNCNNNSQLMGLIEKSVIKSDLVNGAMKDRNAIAPRRRLFSRNEEEAGNSRDRTHGPRSSSETSVFDFPDSDSEGGDLPVLEQMRRVRRVNSREISEIKMESPRPVTPGEDFFSQACDSFIDQLKNGSGKKRGRRKKVMEPDVLAKLETVTKEKPLELNVTIKKEEEEPELKKEEVKIETVDQEDDDSDVPLINCKTKSSEILSSKEEAKTEIVTASTTDNDLPPPKIVEHKTPTKVDVKEIALPRPAKKPNFGDGSDFCPGWEEEVYKYKRSLRMPASLIQVTRPPQYLRLSTSLPDLDPYPNSPTPSSVTELSEYLNHRNKLAKIKTEQLDSDTESNCSFNIFSIRNNYDSEGSSSNKSLAKEGSSILDQLLEKCGGQKKRKYKKKEDVSAKIAKTEKPVELLPTPEVEGVEKKEKTPPKGIANLREAFLKSAARKLKQRINIKEVFGEDRPASAPPVTCVNHIKIKEEVLEAPEALQVDIKREPNQVTDTRQVLKNKLLNNGDRKETNLLKCLVEKKIKTLDEQEDEDMDDGSKGDVDSKSETPSIEGDEGSVSGKKHRNKFRNIRRKLSSGFDYIRKKKKSVKKENQESEVVVKPKRRGPINNKSNPGSVQDIQKEIKGWVLNKGIGETILHRSARLGYTDITAYCLEKMECSPSPKDNAGYTPLHEASTKGHLDIAKMLLLYGANVSESARGGIRPLHEAVENGFVEVSRLLLSYGADPMLATYAGMTPLALASDDATTKLLQNHINDMHGRSTSPWLFAGPASCFDSKESGYNILDDEPSADPSSDEDDVDFELSDGPLPNLYTLHGEASSDRWILLQDLSNLLKIKSRDALLRQICPTGSTSAGSSPSSYKTVLRELKMSDFLEQARCCQFLNIGEKVNTRASKIALVKYTDKVKELLKVEKVTIAVR